MKKMASMIIAIIAILIVGVFLVDSQVTAQAATEPATKALASQNIESQIAEPAENIHISLSEVAVAEPAVTLTDKLLLSSTEVYGLDGGSGGAAAGAGGGPIGGGGFDIGVAQY